MNRQPDIFLADMTSPEVDALVRDERRFIVLLPVGSVEPHGPHLALATDNVISEGAALRARQRLEGPERTCRIAPTVPYGVTECASRFPGAVSVSADGLTNFLCDVVRGFLATGADHVCLINNHLEPAQDRAVRAAAQRFEPTEATVACPLTRRWGRTLSAEFKSGECHAGRYETSLVLGCRPELVVDAERRDLPEVRVSLSEKLGQGVSDFVEMGLDRAYAGAPALATPDEGNDLLDRLATMIVGEVEEAL